MATDNPTASKEVLPLDPEARDAPIRFYSKKILPLNPQTSGEILLRAVCPKLEFCLCFLPLMQSPSSFPLGTDTVEANRQGLKQVSNLPCCSQCYAPCLGQGKRVR